MDIKWVDKKDQIELPSEDIIHAIKKGMNEGRKIKQKKRVRARVKFSAWLSGTAAAVVLASGFVLSPVKTVLAEMPLIGKIYQKLDVEIGKELVKSNLVTEINQKATSNGVDVTVTSAYYDGNVIGVTIEAEGEDLSVENMEKEKSPETGYTIRGKDQDLYPGLRGPLQKLKEGSYVAALEFELNEKELPKDFTLPLQFTHIANKTGDWKFSIPVKQLPVETIKFDESSVSKDGLHQIHINQLSIGKATSNLNYEFHHANTETNSVMHVEVFDENGKRVPLRSDRVVDVTKKPEGIIENKELQIGKIDEDVNYLMVYPEVVSLTNQDRFQLPALKLLIK